MCRDIIISLDREHTENLISGKKTVEVRRRRLRIPSGTRVWIYTKKPQGSINAVGVVLEVHEDSADVLWGKFSGQIGISRDRFDQYLAGVATGCVIEFSKISALRRPMALCEIRRRTGGFQPPQFFKRIDGNWKALALLRRRKTA